MLQQLAFIGVLPTRWRRKPAGIDTERNYVTVTACIHGYRTCLVAPAESMPQTGSRYSVCLCVFVELTIVTNTETDRLTHRSLCVCNNKAVIDRRLHSRFCHQGSYFKRPKSSPVRPLACNWYYCAQFIAKPKAACALRFSWAATSSGE